VAWNQLVTARASLAANETAVKAASIALEGVRLEYQNGLRTTLDVLNAEQERRNAELAVVIARRDAYVAQSALLVAVGHLEAQTLDASIGPRDPLAHFEPTHSGGLWRPWDATWRAVDAFGATSGFPSAFHNAAARPPPHPQR
jgi:outer membrane protein